MQWLILILLIPYIYILLRLYSGLKKITPFSSRETSGTFVSIVVACRNEEIRLPVLLSVVASQNYDPHSFELVVVDDNSSDSTSDIASGFSAIRNLKILKNTGKGKKEALRTGIEASSGNLIITTDADSIPDENWIRTIVSFFEKEKPDLIIAPVILRESGGFTGRFQELEFLSLQGITAATAMAGDPVMCNGANLSFTKSLYQVHNENLHYEKVSGDDIFLLHSAKRDPGRKILWLESVEASVTTESCPCIKKLIRQRSRWLSKAESYSDRGTIILAIVTFVTILIQLMLLTAAFINSGFIWIFITWFVLKSIPDYLILSNTASRYGQSHLLKWFLPSQFIYPVYVVVIAVSALIRGNRWN